MTIDPRRIEVMDEQTAAIMRSKTPAEKIAMASDMWQSAWEMLYFSLREKHSEWDEQTLRREVARRMSRESA